MELNSVRRKVGLSIKRLIIVFFYNIDRKYFFKNQNNLQRQIVAGGFAVNFVASAVSNHFVGVTKASNVMEWKNKVFNLKEQDLKAKKLTYLILSFLAILTIVVFILALCSKKTPKILEETTYPGNQENESEQKSGNQQKDKKKENEQKKKQEVEKKSSSVLKWTETTGRTLLGTGIGIATTALVGQKFNGTAMAGGEKVEVSGENGAVEVIISQGSNIPDSMQNTVEKGEVKGKEKLESKNTSEGFGLEANGIGKIEGEGKVKGSINN